MDEVTAEERATLDLVLALRETGNLNPLIVRLRNGEVGPERARDALRVLAEYDAELLIQITLDALISGYVADPGLAHQPRRQTRSAE